MIQIKSSRPTQFSQNYDRFNEGLLFIYSFICLFKSMTCKSRDLCRQSCFKEVKKKAYLT